ncbi:hydroxycarboxylic acid receptor 2-like [Salarias fasciatus]|uniref:Hydroxycarboxylic acid receptor 2-like n=1 Tax=Salarias fasciatus TaxID=181472 RepID=A0A672GU67_SALFA|nr:hydroxycarboxylic acid receptor 2-like [Salarias fasciatus]
MESVNVSTEMETNTSIHCLNMQQSTDRGVHVFLQIVLITEMIVGLPGSILALWIFCFRLKVWKTHVFFLFNLLLADFLLLASVPFRIDTHLRGDDWVLGRLWCSINLFMLSVNRSASIAFMTVVALDRYFKVVHPHHCISRISLIQARWLSALMWITVTLFRIPLLTTDTLHTNGNVSLCRTFHSYKVTPAAMKVHYVAFTAEFFLPWLLLLFCSFRITSHLRQREMDKQKRVQRAIQAVFVISAVFTFCFMPSVITGLLGLCFKAYHPLDCKSYNRISQLFTMCIGLTYLNSALDPIIYIFSSAMFRVALKKSFRFKKTPQQFHKC